MDQAHNRLTQSFSTGRGGGPQNSHLAKVFLVYRTVEYFMRPASLLFLLFISVPMFELYLLINVGRVIGSLPTIFILVFTAALGAMLVRAQGRHTLMQIQQSLAAGRLPATEMFEGVLIVFAGALLLTPGFVTDTVGFCCLIPAVRRGLLGWLVRRQLSGFNLDQNSQQSPFQGQARAPSNHSEPGDKPVQGGGRVIEGELDQE